jgi:hypothetical protein
MDRGHAALYRFGMNTAAPWLDRMNAAAALLSAAIPSPQVEAPADLPADLAPQVEAPADLPAAPARAVPSFAPRPIELARERDQAAFVRDALAELHLTRAAFGRLIHTDVRQIRRWADGDHPMPFPVRLILRLLLAGNITPADVADAADDRLPLFRDPTKIGTKRYKRARFDAPATVKPGQKSG